MSVHHATQDSDNQMTTLMTIVLASLVLLTTVLFLVAQLISFIAGISLPPSSVKERALENRIARIGRVVIGDPAPVLVAAAPSMMAPASAVSTAPAAASGPIVLAVADLDPVKGQQIYSQACVACHMTGAAGAPMLTAKEDWSQRYEQGFATLVSHAVNGYNAMPAKGGNLALSDEDINHAIAYMLQEIGLTMEVAEASEDAEVVEATSESTEPMAAPSESPMMTIAFDMSKGEQVYGQACAMCHTSGLIGAPMLTAKEDWATRLEQGFDTLVSHAGEGR